MKTALLIICLLEFNVITLLARGLYVKTRSRNMWRKRYEHLSEEYSTVMQNNSILKRNLREIEKITLKQKKYPLMSYFCTILCRMLRWVNLLEFGGMTNEIYNYTERSSFKRTCKR